MDDTEQKPKGLIRYALLVVSHPVQPNPQQTFEFLNKILPELRMQQDDSTKIGTLWETTPIAGIDMAAKAVEAFGASVVNNDLYTYRTLHLGLSGGDAKCLVVYDKTGSSPSSKKWWRFRK